MANLVHAGLNQTLGDIEITMKLARTLFLHKTLMFMQNQTATNQTATNQTSKFSCILPTHCFRRNN